MTGPETGTTGGITARRADCVKLISRLAEQRGVDSNTITRLRQELGHELAALVVSVAALQPKARKKFGPGVWWATARSLQQATPWQVARLKAPWLGDGVTYDLCCGVGGDTMQLATRGPVVAVDRDHTLVEMVAANLVESGAAAGQFQAICGDVTLIEIPRRAAVHIDPDRRAGGDHRAGRRTSQPDQYEPAWSDVLAIIAKTGHAVVKLAPAGKLDITRVPGSHRCWISLAGSVREQSLLSGSAVELANLQPDSRSAVALANDGSACWFLSETDDLGAAPPDRCVQPREVLIDPDAAIRAAGLTEAYARKHALAMLGSPSGYLTCDSSATLLSSSAPMAVIGEVIWSGSCDDRKLRKELRHRGVYPAVIKVRGTHHDPAQLFKRYRKCGDQPVALWIGRTGSGVVAALTEPLNHGR